MRFDDYDTAAEVTAIYPEAGTGSVAAVTYLALGLGETGEIQGKVKKVLRDDNGELSEARREGILAEMGDVLWYLSRLAVELGYSLSDVAAANIEKLADRDSRGGLSGSGDNR